jgi:hypothetical protein
MSMTVQNEEYDKTQKSIIEYIDKNGFKYSFLAKKARISKAAFSQKMKNKTFNQRQLSRLYNFFIGMCTETRKIQPPLASIDDID